MPPVTIYTRQACGYCSRAKDLLSRKGVAFEEKDATLNPAFRQEMTARAPAARPSRRSSSARPMSAAATISTRWTGRASSIRCWRLEGELT